VNKEAILMIEKSQLRSVSSNSRAPRCPRWAAVVTVAVLVALALLLVACGSSSSQAPSQKVQALLKDHWTAVNSGDSKAIAQAYASNAVLDNYADETNVQLGTGIGEYFGGIVKDLRMQWHAQGEPTVYDKYVIQPVTMTQIEGTGTGAAIHVFEVNSSDQIAHEWIIGWAKE
jgi:hypothetical protein